MKALTSFAIAIIFALTILASAFMVANVYAAGATTNGRLYTSVGYSFVSLNATNQSTEYTLFNLTTDENYSNVFVPQLMVCNSTNPGCLNISATTWISTGGTNNFTNATVNLTTPEGRYNVTFYWRNASSSAGWDSGAYNKTLTFNFYSDRTPPRWTSILTVANNTNRSISEFMTNITVDFTYTYKSTVYVEFSNETAATNYTLPCTATATMSSDGYTPLYTCGKTLNTSGTSNQTVYFNYTIYLTDGSGNVNKSGLYQFKVDNSTGPTIGSGIFRQSFYNSSTNGRNENTMNITFNVTSNNTDTQMCFVRAWVESTDINGVKTWTLSSANNLSGYYETGGMTLQFKNCTIQVNGTDIKNIMGNSDVGVIKLEAGAIDNMGHVKYGLNHTVTYNSLKTGWNPIGWVGAASQLRQISGYVNFNASYVSVWDNDFQNGSWINWLNPVNAANTTTVNNHNASAVYLYMNNPWIMLRGNTSKTAADQIWVPVNPVGINQTWSIYSTGIGYSAGNLSLYCLGENLSFRINTSGTFVAYQNFSKIIYNQATDANGSWGNPSNVNSMLGGSNYTYNSTCFNITNYPSQLFTNINYTTTPAKSSWQAYSTVTANTTNQTLSQLNATDIAWQNISDTRCTGGCFVYYTSAQPYINNETVIPGGAMVWVLPDTSGWSRYSFVNVINPGTATGSYVQNGMIGANNVVKLWSRPAV
jgi:hypothetical protein